MALKEILETLIFASGTALGTSEMMEILEEISPGEKPARADLEKALELLQSEWEARGGGISLVKVAEGYEFRTRTDYAPWVKLLNRPNLRRLSQPAVETLSLVAYRQPITRTDIESVRGVDTAAVLKNLLERRLIRVVGRKEEPGRPLLYATTGEFLELFGLKDLSDLPPLKELEEMIKNQAEATPAGPENLSVSDLMSTPEDLASLEDSDREALEELDQSIRDLKELEKKVVEDSPKPEEPLPDINTKAPAQG